MRRCVLSLIVASVVAATGFAPAPLPKRERHAALDDLVVMQGLWQMTSYESNNRPVGYVYKVRIKGNRWTFLSTGGGQEVDAGSYDYNLDPTQHPRAFEWTNDRGNSGFVGSYKLEDNGKRLTILYLSGTLKQAQNRPTDFSGATSWKITLRHLGRE